jgi:hypothetical protein
MKHLFISIIALSLLGFSSCKKDDSNNNSDYNPNKKGVLTVEFDNIAGSSDLQLNSGSYTNSSGESFNVTRLKYYVSNFILTRTDGTIYTVPQDSCYFLIDESDEATHEPVLNIPEGEYKTLSFTLGIDSLRSTMDAAELTGVLDPTGPQADMYWGGNSGFIFLKMEGNASASATGNYIYHIGGFGGQTSSTINNIKHVTLDLSARGVPQVKQGKETNIHLMVDVLKLFNGNSSFSIADHPVVMFETFSTTIANNFTAMFRHDHTEN